MILLRHGQSEFNLHFSATRRDPGIPDPVLTPLGHEQAAAAAEALAGQDIRRIVASPYTRALQTAAPAARRFGLPIHVTPAVRERYAFVCDVGSPRTALAAAFPNHDFTAIQEMWWPQFEEPVEEVEARARAFRAEMAEQDDGAHTLVVTHWGFIMASTGQTVANGDWLRVDLRAPPPETISWVHG